MADVEARILLTTTGGDASAAEISKAKGAIENVTASSSQLQEKFQERFQHIGLHVFAGQALESIGLTGETRQAVQLMNTALVAVETAAGISTGGLTLLITALAAVAAIVYKVVNHHKDHIEVLGKLSTELGKAVDDTNKQIAALEHYAKAVGGLDGQQQALLDTTKALNALQREQASSAAGEILGAMQKQKIGIEDTIAALQQEKDHIEKTAKAVGAYSELGFDSEGKAAGLKRVNAEITKQNEAVIKLNKAIEDQINKIRVYGNRTVADYDKAAQAAEKSAQDRQKASDKLDAHERSIMDVHIKAFIDGQQAMTEAQDKELKKQGEAVFKGTQFISKSFSQAFAKSIVEGEDFGKVMEQQFQRMAERFIEYVLQMMIEWIALKAVMEIWGGPGVAAYHASAMAAYPGLAYMGMSTATTDSGGHAIGGSVFADRPTMAMFGEGGPEVATFTPMTGGGAKRMSGGGGGDMYFGDINVSVSGVSNPDAVARQIGQKIVEQIRGQGQLNFSR